jgi:hypothetical protein
MHQSGTHWLKFMLASAMAEHYGILTPKYNHANDIIGGAKDEHRYKHLPELRSTHTIAPLLLRNRLAVSLAKLPPCVVLVRDIRMSLVSNYHKWQDRYAVSFSEYLRGDPSGRRYNSDLWWCIRFLNAWTAMEAVAAGRVRIVRYETLLDDPHTLLDQIAQHFGISLSAPSIDVGVNAASKSSMVKLADPARPAGEINQSNDNPLSAFSRSDREFLRTRCAAYLDNALGYDYSLWD